MSRSALAAPIQWTVFLPWIACLKVLGFSGLTPSAFLCSAAMAYSAVEFSRSISPLSSVSLVLVS
eukprot:1400299-Rhodomonas_salina.1